MQNKEISCLMGVTKWQTLVNLFRIILTILNISAILLLSQGYEQKLVIMAIDEKIRFSATCGA